MRSPPIALMLVVGAVTAPLGACGGGGTQRATSSVATHAASAQPTHTRQSTTTRSVSASRSRSTTTASAPVTGQSPCPGGSVAVTANASCSLAEDVFRAAQDAFVATGHLPTHLTASDPATGRTYQLSCMVRDNGSQLVCVTAPPARETVVVRVAAISGHSSGASGAKFTPTPAQVAQAKQALPQCQKEQPGITLQQLEREAASSVGIQC